MNAASFQVALTGLKDGHAAEDVAHRLARMFRQPPEKMLTILDGKRRVLKKGLSEAEARKYEVALQDAGCDCSISTDAPATSAAAAPAPEPGAAGAPAAPVAAESSGRNFFADAPAPRPGGSRSASAAAASASASAPASASASASAAASAAAASGSESAEEFGERQSKLSLYHMGAGQNFVILAIVLNGVAIGLRKQLGLLPEFIASLSVCAVMISGLIGMCRGLGYSMLKRSMLIILMFIPLLNLITLVVLSSKTSKALKEEGIRVGLAGASSDDLAKLAVEAGLPQGTRPRAMMAFIGVLLVFGICFAVSSHYREKEEQEAALEMNQPCELAGVWNICSRLGDFQLTLDENGKMFTSDAKAGDWRFEAGELLLTEKTSTTHYKILRATDGYVLERMGVVHTMLPKQALPGKRCAAA